LVQVASRSLIFENRRFSQNITFSMVKLPKDGSETIFKIFFVRLSFYLRFWFVLGPILTPFWLHLGSLSGAQNWPKSGA
jgi:hypothetical protein